MQTDSALQTKKIAQSLGEKILESRKNTPTVIALQGDLGAGKTTFVKGLAKGLEIKANITSPTFVLINKYVSSIKSQDSKVLYHVDPYRLDDPKKIEADIKELLTQKNAVIAIEWAERVKRLLPKDTIWVTLRHKGKSKRNIVITSHGTILPKL